MELQAQVTPAMLAGVAQAGGEKIVSPEARDVLDRLKEHYQSLGKPSAAHNYHRHLKSFFAWAENRGYSVRGLPSDAVESFLSDLQNAGQKESTVYVMRTQLKSALREAHNALGVDFAHLEYQTGKPREVRRAQKEREKAKRHEKRMAQTIAQAQAIMAAQQSGQPLPRPDMPDMNFSFNDTPVAAPAAPLEPPMSTASAPEPVGATQTGAVQQGQPPVVVVQMPPQNQRPTATIGQAPKAPANGQPTTTVGRGMTISSHTFTGPYLRISRMADGTDPLTPPGTETYITTVPLTQLLPHGDAAAYLQSFVLPNLRLAPTVGQVHFVFHELNDRRQPTGRRDEMVVSVPMGMAPAAQQAPAQGALNGMPSQQGFYGQPSGDRATDYLLRKLDEESASARKRAEELQEKLRVEKDAQTTFLLMQQFQKEQDLRRELETQRNQAMAQMQMMAMPPPAPMPMPVIDSPKPDSSAEMVRAMAENQARMMETMMSGMRPQPPPPQKDAAEWLVPFINSMNSQQQAQQQANQQLLVSIMQSNQQFMQAMLTRENPVEKMLLMQLQEVKAAANAPKGDEMEDFAEKLQKMKMVSDMLGGGGGNAPSLIGELLSNAEAIGEGAAKIIAASRTKVVLPPNSGPTAMNGVAQPQALPPAGPQGAVNGAPAAPPKPPDLVIQSLTELKAAAAKEDDQEIVTSVVNIVRGLIEGGEPFSRMGQKILNAYREMDDADEMYTLSKSLWIVGGEKADKKLAKVVAAALVRWYSVIHEQLFGVAREIGGEEPAQTAQDEQSDEEIDQEEGGEDEESAAAEA